MSAFPPHKSIPSIPVSQEIALKYLQDYLTLASTTPYLLPNAKLEPTGPTVGSSHSSVTIHNLQRVEAGLRGEWLAPTLELEEGEGVGIAKGMDDGTQQGSGEGDQMQVDGWQDMEEFQREQGIEEEETNPTVRAKQMDDGLEIDASTNEGFSLPQEDKELSKKDKDTRKADKKAKRKAEQREKEMKKQGLANQ